MRRGTDGEAGITAGSLARATTITREHRLKKSKRVITALVTASATAAPATALVAQSASAISLKPLASPTPSRVPTTSGCAHQSPEVPSGAHSGEGTGTGTGAKSSADLTAATSPSSATPLSPSSVSIAADGSTQYSYHTATGAQFTYVLPPLGFDPLTATSAQLAAYNFPPRPTSASELQLWTTMMEFYKSSAPANFKSAAGQAQTAEGAGGGQQGPPAGSSPDSEAGPAETSNWSGWMDNSRLNSSGDFDQLFTSVGAKYIQPAQEATPCGYADSVTWVGLGGWNENSSEDFSLVQAGSFPGGGEAPLCQAGVENCAWYEWLTNHEGTVPITIYNPDMAINNGDSVEATVDEISSTLVDFTVEDYTSGEMANIQVTVPFVDGSSAEYIQEAPTGPLGPDYGGQEPLKGFSTFNWYNAEAYDSAGNQYTIEDGPNPTKITMMDPAFAHVLGTASGLGSSGSSFSSTWVSCS